MKRRSLIGTAAAIVASIVLTGSSLAAFTGLINGSFEDAAAGTSPGSIGSKSGLITGWTVTGVDIDWVDASLWPAQQGTKSIDLNGHSPGGIQQILATTPNNRYFVSFYLSGNPGTCQQFPDGLCSPDNKTMIVTTVGGTAETYAFDTSVSGNTFANMMWQQMSYSFVATSATTFLGFVSTTVGAFGPAIDNVVVTETSATGANCKDGGWQTMSDTTGNGFKNQGDCVSFFGTDGRNLGAVTP